jgi:hypothetical protein
LFKWDDNEVRYKIQRWNVWKSWSPCSQNGVTAFYCQNDLSCNMTERLPTRFPPPPQKTASCNALSYCHVRARCGYYLVRPLKNAPGKLKHIKPVPAHLHPGKPRKFNRSGTASDAGRKEADGVEYYLKLRQCV